MEKECYYFRHKINQELYVYLELGETWEESFLMEFCMADTAPHYIRTGALYENRHILIAFKYIAITPITDVMKDKKLEWKPIQSDSQLDFITKTFIESFIKTNP